MWFLSGTTDVTKPEAPQRGLPERVLLPLVKHPHVAAQPMLCSAPPDIRSASLSLELPSLIFFSKKTLSYVK